MLKVSAMSGFGAGGGSVTTSSASGLWEGATDDYTFVGDDVASDTQNKSIRLIDAQYFTGNFEVNGTLTVGSTLYIGIYDIAEDSTFNENIDSADLGSMTHSWWWERMGATSFGTLKYGSATQANDIVADGATIKLERVGSTIKFYEDGTAVHTFSQTSSNTLRLILSAANPPDGDLDDLSWTVPG